MSSKFISLLCLLVASFPAWSQTAKPSNGKINEHYSSNVPVSGNILVGAMYLGSSVQDSFHLSSPQDTSHFCFKVTSIDGTYVSENDYLIAEQPKSALTPLEYPTQYQDILKNFAGQQLAMLATTGECQDQRYQHVMLSARAPENNGTELVFLVSSGRSQVFMQITGAERQRFGLSCSRIEEGKRTAFDTICAIKAEQVPTGTYTAQIVRRKEGRSLPATKFTFSVL